MSMENDLQVFSESIQEPEIPFKSFSERMKEIRKDKNMSLEEFSKLLGTSKQALSRYELGQCDPKISQVRKYAKKLHLSVDYLLGDLEAETDKDVFWKRKKKRQPFYKIFIEVTADRLGLDIPGVVQKTGLTDWEVRQIIIRRIEVAPLELALRLSETLDVPLETWIDTEYYTPSKVSIDGYEVARAYDQADIKSKNMVRMVLDLPMVKEETV